MSNLESPQPLNIAAEGVVDGALASAVCIYLGIVLKTVYLAGNKEALRQKINGYNYAARHALWWVLADLDREECAPRMAQEWLPERNSGMCLRIAVPQSEAWLLADREGISSFLRVDINRIPIRPEELSDAKEAMVNLARRSRSKSVREDMVPRQGGTARIGPAYSARLIEFIGSNWDIERASSSALSLNACLAAMRRLTESASRGSSAGAP